MTEINSVVALDIEKSTINNNYYRKVIATTDQMQLVLMSIKPGIEIGPEKHTDATQFIRVERGKASVIVKNMLYSLTDGSSIIIPPDTQHNVINSGNEDLKLYTLYAPPQHPHDAMEFTKGNIH
jgi:mannose-6-phosphate isomerase-like protein (cupin superfamily)